MSNTEYSLSEIANIIGVSKTLLSLRLANKRSLKPDIEGKFQKLLPHLKAHKAAKFVNENTVNNLNFVDLASGNSPLNPFVKVRILDRQP